MKNQSLVKFILVYVVAKAIGIVTGLAYNPLLEEFNFISLVIDLGIWIITFYLVGLIFSKLGNNAKS